MNNALIDYNRTKWAAAGYKNMASAWACLPPAGSSDIRLYHLTDADHAISDIVLERLKIARISDLNDPFELVGVKLRAEPAQRVVAKFKKDFDAQSGLISFSDNWAQPVLWSHYAEKHKGICLGFDVPRKSVDKIVYALERVDLVSEPHMTTLPAGIDEVLMRTKAAGWAYEQEYRRFVELSTAIPEGPLHFVRFGSDLRLAEVILGMYCTVALTDVRAQVEKTYKHEVAVYKARPAWKFFSVVPDEETIPNPRGIGLAATTA